MLSYPIIILIHPMLRITKDLKGIANTNLDVTVYYNSQKRPKPLSDSNLHSLIPITMTYRLDYYH